MRHTSTLSVEEQARRRTDMRDALAQVRLEGLEPDPIVFTYIERYVHGEMTLANALVFYTDHLSTILRTSAQAR
jgi:hypothetical protein